MKMTDKIKEILKESSILLINAQDELGKDHYDIQTYLIALDRNLEKLEKLLTDEELNRPNIVDCFDKKATLEDVQKEYDKSPILFKYLVQLDLYIDKLEEELKHTFEYKLEKTKRGEDYELCM